MTSRFSHGAKFTLIVTHPGRKKSIRSDASPEAHLAEITSDGVVLDVPAEFCRRGETLRLEMKAGELEVTMMGKVVKQTLGERDMVFLELANPHEREWFEFTKMLMARQSDVQRLFAALKE